MKKINDEKIDKYLDELTEEYKELLLEALLKKSNLGNELSVSELLRIDNRVKKYLQKQEENKRDRKFLVLGIAYTLLGLFMYLLSDLFLKFYELRYLSTLDLVQIMSIIIGFVGAISCLYPFIRKYKDSNASGKNLYKSEHIGLIEYEVINTWRMLEGICNDIALKNDMVINKSVIQFLSNAGLINEEEKNVLTNFLKLRNLIVHGNQIKVPKEELRNEIRKVDDLIERINYRLSPNKKYLKR